MKQGIPHRFFWSWDHSTNWTLHAYGAQNCGVSNAYAKAPEMFLQDYKRVVDFAAAHKMDAVGMAGMLRESHGGVEAARQLCNYAAEKGVRIYMIAGLFAYGGIYYEGELLIEEEYAAFLPYHNKMAILTRADGRAHLWLCQQENGKWILDPTPFVLGEIFQYDFPFINEPSIAFYYPFRNDGFSDPPDTLWIATKKSLLSVSLGNWLSNSAESKESVQITEHTVPDYWDKLHIANMTQIENTLYFGEHFGVLKAELSDSEATFTFYPVDYQSILQKEK